MINLGQLEHELATAYRGQSRPVWKESEAKAIAEMVHKDMTSVGFDLELTKWPPVLFPWRERNKRKDARSSPSGISEKSNNSTK